jgi:hypothetical protein
MKLMVTKIVLFCLTPAISFKRLGVEVLESNGFEVRVYDFSPIVFPKLYEGLKSRLHHTSEIYSLFNEKKKAVQAIQNLGDECFVVMLGFYHAESFKIFRPLSKTNIPYAIYSANTFPGTMGCKEGSFLERVLLKLYRCSFRKLKALIYKPIFAPLFGIRPPNICVLGGESTLNNTRSAALIRGETELLWAHGLDYDNYLDRLQKRETQANIAVFIDIGDPMFHADRNLKHGVAHLTCERYYPSLCRFFDYVEKELKLEVVIAAHPKGKHVDYPEYFGGRRVFRDQSLQLIKKSKLVISHQSTALNYVVLEKKPLLFITTAEYEADLSYSKFLKLNGSWLGKRVINIDEVPYSISWKKELSVNEEMYLKYRQQYIKKEDSEDLNTWQILANRLKREL